MPSDASQASAVQDEAVLRVAEGGANWRCRYCGSDQRRADGACARCGAAHAEGRDLGAAPAPGPSPPPAPVAGASEGVSARDPAGCVFVVDRPGGPGRPRAVPPLALPGPPPPGGRRARVPRRRRGGRRRGVGARGGGRALPAGSGREGFADAGNRPPAVRSRRRPARAPRRPRSLATSPPRPTPRPCPTAPAPRPTPSRSAAARPARRSPRPARASARPTRTGSPPARTCARAAGRTARPSTAPSPRAVRSPRPRRCRGPGGYAQVPRRAAHADWLTWKAWAWTPDRVVKENGDSIETRWPAPDAVKLGVGLAPGSRSGRRGRRGTKCTSAGTTGSPTRYGQRRSTNSSASGSGRGTWRAWDAMGRCAWWTRRAEAGAGTGTAR